jgi:hypothetical protein
VKINPTVRISILEDTDGDGAMDKRTIFSTASCCRVPSLSSTAECSSACRLGCSTCATPTATIVRMRRPVLFEDYGDRGNPEHQANGPLHGIDNWIYNSNYGRRLRRVDGKWVSSTIPDPRSVGAVAGQLRPALSRHQQRFSPRQPDPAALRIAQSQLDGFERRFAHR